MMIGINQNSKLNIIENSITILKINMFIIARILKLFCVVKEINNEKR